MRLPARSGFTLVEVIVATAILAFTVLGVGTFSTGVLRYNRTLTQALDTETQSRRAVAQFTRELRTASPSSLGAYPVEQATATSLTFYANVDADTYRERLRYFVSAGNLRRGITEPSGTPLTYNPANETVVTLVEDVQNNDVFSYYDDTYDGASPALPFPVATTAVRLVHLKLTVDDDPATAPAALDVATDVHLRNLKDV